MALEFTDKLIFIAKSENIVEHLNHTVELIGHDIMAGSEASDLLS